jgi:hypothetical protein
MGWNEVFSSPQGDEPNGAILGQTILQNWKGTGDANTVHAGFVTVDSEYKKLYENEQCCRVAPNPTKDPATARYQQCFWLDVTSSLVSFVLLSCLFLLFLRLVLTPVPSSLTLTSLSLSLSHSLSHTHTHTHTLTLSHRHPHKKIIQLHSIFLLVEKQPCGVMSIVLHHSVRSTERTVGWLIQNTMLPTSSHLANKSFQKQPRRVRLYGII